MAPVRYEGIAMMYLSMPMAQQSLPLMGECSMEDKKITLKFPLTNVSFDLPEPPKPSMKDMEFKMAGPRGEMVLKISFRPDLKAFIGEGRQMGQKVLTFVFHDLENPLKQLKEL